MAGHYRCDSFFGAPMVLDTLTLLAVHIMQE